MAWQPGMTITAQRLLDNTPHTISYTSLTSNTSTATSTETVALTTPSNTFRNGRAYRVTYKGLAQSSVANDSVTVRVRKTDTAGEVYIDSFRLAIPAAGANVPFCLSNILTNTSGADITAVWVGTFVRVSGGTGNVLLAATSTHVAYIELEDIGEAVDFPTARAMT